MARKPQRSSSPPRLGKDLTDVLRVRTFLQRLRGRSHPLQSWQCELSTLEDEAPLELTPCALLVETFAFHNEIRHET